MGNLPIKKYRAGAIEGVIWLNKKRRDDGSEIEFKTATLRRSWKDREQNLWREEKINLRRTDLPKVAIILHQLQADMYLSLNDHEGGDDDE